MSTTHPLFTQDELTGFTNELKEWPATAFDNGDFEIAVSPFTSFYFLYEPHNWRETSLLMVALHEEFESLTGKPYKIATHPESERPYRYGSKRLPNLRSFIDKMTADQSFLFSFTDEENTNSSPAVAAYFCRKRDYLNKRPQGDDRPPAYSYVQFYYRWQWWQDNKEAWRRFLLNTIERLRPQQVYSGFAIANPLAFGTRSEVSVWERSLTERFYGLDIDYPFGMSMGMDESLPAGLKAPTWGFFLSDEWRAKLDVSRQYVVAFAEAAGIHVTVGQTGLWLELGDEPGLYPVEDGVPPMHVALNTLLRPLRNDALELIGTGEWDGDPNVRFNRDDARRWLGRFDEESDWPSADARIRSSFSSKSRPTSVAAGQQCPRSGWWFTPARTSSRKYINEGEVFPAADTSYGATFWQWDIDQSDPRL